MFGIGLPEMILILALALIVVGPDKLPELARSVAKGVLELKKTVSALKEDLADENPFDAVKPELEETARHLESIGLSVSVLPNGYVLHWLFMLGLNNFLAHITNSDETARKINAYYNKHCYSRDNVEPCYRRIIVALHVWIWPEVEVALAPSDVCFQAKSGTTLLRVHRSVPDPIRNRTHAESTRRRLIRFDQSPAVD